MFIFLIAFILGFMSVLLIIRWACKAEGNHMAVILHFSAKERKKIRGEYVIIGNARTMLAGVDRALSEQRAGNRLADEVTYR